MGVALCAIRCQANRCLRLQVGQQPGRPDADALLAEEVRRGRLTSPALKNAGAPPSPPPVAPLFMPHRVKRIDRVTADSSPPAAPSDGRNTDFSTPRAGGGTLWMHRRLWRRGSRRRGAYPRAGGGTRRSQVSDIRSRGPIPAQAGEPWRGLKGTCLDGPIPAQAGERVWATPPPGRAYPRAGGRRGSLFRHLPRGPVAVY